jgi:hypothetical protein
MSINLKPETEQILVEEMQSGHFQTVDELILEGLGAWRERHQQHPTDTQRLAAVESALDFAKNKAIPLKGLSIRELLHEG